MDRSNELFLQILRSAIRGESAALDNESKKYLSKIYQLSAEHHVLPLIADTLFNGTKQAYAAAARDLTIGQAQRTADFLLLLRILELSLIHI